MNIDQRQQLFIKCSIDAYHCCCNSCHNCCPCYTLQEEEKRCHRQLLLTLSLASRCICMKMPRQFCAINRIARVRSKPPPTPPYAPKRVATHLHFDLIKTVGGDSNCTATVLACVCVCCSVCVCCPDCRQMPASLSLPISLRGGRQIEIYVEISWHICLNCNCLSESIEAKTVASGRGSSTNSTTAL